MKPETTPTRLLAILAMAAALTSSLALMRGAIAAQSIHVWTDDAGRTHYSNLPAERPAARTLAAPPVPTAEESAAERQRAERARDELTKWRSRRESVVVIDNATGVPCERALRIVDFLRDYPELPVLRPHDAGQVSLMDEAQRQEVLDRAQADLRQRCQYATEVDMNDLWTGLFWPRTARAAQIVPTQFLPQPVVQEPALQIRGGRPSTTPVTPTTSLVNARRPVAPAVPSSGVVGSRAPVAPSGAGGVSIR